METSHVNFGAKGKAGFGQEALLVVTDFCLNPCRVGTCTYQSCQTSMKMLECLVSSCQCRKLLWHYLAV